MNDTPTTGASIGAIAATTVEEQPDDIRDRLRAVYSQAFDDIADRVLADLLLPSMQASVLYDMAQFMTFLVAVKLCEALGKPPTRENLMAVYWPAQKALKDEVPGQLRAFAEAVAKR